MRELGWGNGGCTAASKKSVIASVSTVKPAGIKVLVPILPLLWPEGGRNSLLTNVVNPVRTMPVSLYVELLFNTSFICQRTADSDWRGRMSSSDLARLQVDDIASFLLWRMRQQLLYMVRADKMALYLLRRKKVKRKGQHFFPLWVFFFLHRLPLEFLADPITHMKPNNEAILRNPTQARPIHGRQRLGDKELILWFIRPTTGNGFNDYV